MKTLYLLRHGHAEPDATAAEGDHGRRLTHDGIREAERAARFMHDNGCLPDVILASSATRTRQTAEIVSAFIAQQGGNADIPTQFDRSLYLASPETMFERLCAIDDACHNLLLVGHNPGIGDIVMRLAFACDRPIVEFPTAALAAFNSPAASWAEVSDSNLKLLHCYNVR